MKQTIAMFCYRGEEELLPMTIAQTRSALPLATIHLFDDAKDPIPLRLAAALQEMAGVYYKQTSFNRGINLNGPECVRGVLQSLTDAADADSNTDGIIIKMDPDTLILRSGPLQNALAQGAEWVSHNSMHGHFAGMFYAMSRPVLDTVFRNAKLVDLDEHCAEDETIGALCYLAAMKRRYIWTDVSVPQNRKFFAAFPTTSIDSPDYATEIAYVAKEGCIITVGNTNIDGYPRSYRTKVMRDLLAAFSTSGAPTAQEGDTKGESGQQAPQQAPAGANPVTLVTHPAHSASIQVPPTKQGSTIDIGSAVAGFRVEDDDNDK